MNNMKNNERKEKKQTIMSQAIDNSFPGQQKIVDAEEFRSRDTMPTPGRFLCTFCREEVRLRRRNSRYHFFHSKKTNLSRNCEKRTEGIQLNYYEIAGLPLYLEKIEQGRFKLMMGFGHLDDSVLKQAENENQKIKIKNEYGQVKNQYSINTSRFGEGINRFEVNFIPYVDKNKITNCNNYIINYNNTPCKKELEKQWGNFADGFAPNGAVFAFNEYGGKKIRKGETITSNQDYYLVKRNNRIFKKNVSYEKVGQLTGKLSNYIVYKIRILLSSDDVGYEQLDAYFRETLGLKIIDRESKIISIWPPVIEHDDEIQVFPYSKTLWSKFETSQENEIVNVYYPGAKPVKKKPKDGMIKSLYNKGTIIALNSQYSSNALFLNKVKNQIIGFSRKSQININNSKLEIEENQKIFYTLNNSIDTLKIKVNCPTIIINKQRAESIIINEEGMQKRLFYINPKEKIQLYFIITRGKRIKKYGEISFNPAQDSIIKNDSLLGKECNNIGKKFPFPLVSIPPKIKTIIKERVLSDQCLDIKAYYSKKQIPLAVVRYIINKEKGEK